MRAQRCWMAKGSCSVRSSVLFLFLSLIYLSVQLQLLVVSNEGNERYERFEGIPRVQACEEGGVNSPACMAIRTEAKTISIAHVVSLVQCHDDEATRGYVDGAAVLRHSIQIQSQRMPNASNQDHGTIYQPKFYAIIHDDCSGHPSATALRNLGFIILIRPTPVALSEMPPGWYKDHVETENCCGSKEFIKLYAYTLVEHPIFVLWDLDTMLLQPMDSLFDAMLHPSHTPTGKAARGRITVQYPPLPHRIAAFFTRDITSARPWELRQAVQGGFLVGRPCLAHFQLYLDIIRRAEYLPGRGNGTGWGGMGYGGFQGAMAFQGIVAYFYDQVIGSDAIASNSSTPVTHAATNRLDSSFRISSTSASATDGPQEAVELDVCLWNQVVADVVWRGPDDLEFYGQCRNHYQSSGCKDCRITPIDNVHSVHFTACKKPWECIQRRNLHKRPLERDREVTNETSCRQLRDRWFALRMDLEDRLEMVGIAKSRRDGQYQPDVFHGYCTGPNRRPDHYIPMNLPTNSSVLSSLYT